MRLGFQMSSICNSIYNMECRQGATGAHKMPVVSLKILVSGVVSLISILAIIARGNGRASASRIHKSMCIIRQELGQSLFGLGQPNSLGVYRTTVFSNVPSLSAFEAESMSGVFPAPVRTVELHWFRLRRQAGFVFVRSSRRARKVRASIGRSKRRSSEWGARVSQTAPLVV